MNENGKNLVLERMGLFPEEPLKPVLSEDEQARAEFDRLSNAWGHSCNTLDICLKQTVEILAKFSPKKRKAVSEGVCKMFDL